jgi:cell fate (sporulation/competence/biofilm development) regulator YlbF (YheA/YmcA/DUF963 family)
MQAILDETLVIQKTRDLCQTIVDQPEFLAIRQRIQTFMADETTRNQYQSLMEKGDSLQQKQQFGAPLNQEEILEFERDRESLLSNPVARDFLDAQQSMHKLQESVMQYVGKTFELGRVPATEDFPSDSCGPTCGCGH